MPKARRTRAPSTGKELFKISTVKAMFHAGYGLKTNYLNPQCKTVMAGYLSAGHEYAAAQVIAAYAPDWGLSQ
jgi:hypothetical protein